ncbi:MAG: 2-hydroxyacyl-CoA dehydratase [Deltaproteobacteria bacterium]|nr:2-hydroxyacyl-CoA dehydratase [Deltaproteobacteria bacterium]
MKNKEKIGFMCAYTPLALIDAAGYAPYRILPSEACEDRAGHLLHDNLCPNIKKILDRALAGDVPDLAGVVFVNSCDAMRRLADAWQHVRKDDRIIWIDLPSSIDAMAHAYVQGQVEQMGRTLLSWSGSPMDPMAVEKSITSFNRICAHLSELAPAFASGAIPGGYAAMQALYNKASTRDFTTTLEEIEPMPGKTPAPKHDAVPVYLFGNVLPDPKAFDMFESCGAMIADADFCTGSRLFSPVTGGQKDVYSRLTSHLMTKPQCARSFDPALPGEIAKTTLSRARAVNAAGVIGHVIKFCDPYLERLPGIREHFKKNNMPLLILEGDCTLRSMGQQRTRIEAFIEMLM